MVEIFKWMILYLDPLKDRPLRDEDVRVRGGRLDEDDDDVTVRKTEALANVATCVLGCRRRIALPTKVKKIKLRIWISVSQSFLVHGNLYGSNKIWRYPKLQINMSFTRNQTISNCWQHLNNFDGLLVLCVTPVGNP